MAREIKSLAGTGHAHRTHIKEIAICECNACHWAEDEEGFAVVPHRIAAGGPPDCLECHRDDFEERIEEFHRSVHTRRMPEISANPSSMEDSSTMGVYRRMMSNIRLE